MVFLSRTWFLVRLEFRNVTFWGETKTRVPREKPLKAWEGTNNKLNPCVASTPGFEPGPQWQETCSCTAAPSFAPLLFAGIQKRSTHWSHLPFLPGQELDTATQPITHQFLKITTLMHCVWICRWRWRWWAFAVWIRCSAKRMDWRGVRQLGRPAKQMERCHPSTKAASWARQKGDKSRFHNFHLLNPQ